MIRRRGGREALVGVVVAAAILVFAGAILLIGEQTQLFRPKVGYWTLFRTVSGLRVGSPVSMSGVQIGSVSAIRLPTDPGTEGIEVDLKVDEAYRRRVREGTRASLALLQYVTNEKYIELSPGDPDRPLLPEGSQIPVEEGMEILEAGRTIADNLEDVTVALLSILEKVQSGEGLLGQAIMDPEFGQEGLAALKGAAQGAESLLERMNRGEGLAGRLVGDADFAVSVTGDFRDALDRVVTILERLEQGRGALGQLLQEGEGEGEEEVRGMLADLRAAAASLRRSAESLESRESLLGRFAHDPDFGARTSARIEEILDHLASIARKVDEGEGSLGALVNDPSLHRAAQDVVYGARDSRLVSWALRHYREKGEGAGRKGGEAP